MTAIHYRTAKVDGLNVFYREAGPQARRSSCCCTAFRPPATCSATSSRCSPTAFISSRPIYRASATPIMPEQREHLRPDRGRRSIASPRSSASTACCLCVRLRCADRVSPRGPASGADDRDHLPERQRLRRGPKRRMDSDPGLLAGSVCRQSRRRCAPFSSRRRRAGNIRMACPTRRGCRPDGYTLDSFYMSRPGVAEVQLDLFGDYKSNVALYPTFQQYFRTHKPPLLAVWGKNDPFFLPPGAEAFKRDIPNATVRFFDTGHFALETHARRSRARSRIHPSLKPRFKGGPHGEVSRNRHRREPRHWPRDGHSAGARFLGARPDRARSRQPGGAPRKPLSRGAKRLSSTAISPSRRRQSVVDQATGTSAESTRFSTSRAPSRRSTCSK